jgi:hypothetical protein
MIKFYCKQIIVNLKKICINIANIIGLLWTTSELLRYFLPQYSEVIDRWFKILIIIGTVVNILYYLLKKEFEYEIKGQDIKIRLVIGNIFREKGSKVISTNTTFDTKMEGEFISSRSLQGQLQEKYYRNNISILDNMIDTELNNLKSIETLNRVKSKNKRYNIGTTIKLNINNSKYYFLAIADVNESGRPKATYENILISLQSLWQYILEKGHMEPVVIPLLGTGRTGITEPRQKIIKQIIFSFVVNSKTSKISNELVICIKEEDIYKYNINIGEIKEYLTYMCKYHYDNDDLNNNPSGIPII